MDSEGDLDEVPCDDSERCDREETVLWKASIPSMSYCFVVDFILQCKYSLRDSLWGYSVDSGGVIHQLIPFSLNNYEANLKYDSDHYPA